VNFPGTVAERTSAGSCYAAVAQVARCSHGPLAAEFARVLQEMQIGKSRSEALRAMGDRTSVPELRAFVSAMIQSAELGIPIAQVLRQQATAQPGGWSRFSTLRSSSPAG